MCGHKPKQSSWMLQLFRLHTFLTWWDSTTIYFEIKGKILKGTHSKWFSVIMSGARAASCGRVKLAQSPKTRIQHSTTVVLACRDVTCKDLRGLFCCSNWGKQTLRMGDFVLQERRWDVKMWRASVPGTILLCCGGKSVSSLKNCCWASTEEITNMLLSVYMWGTLVKFVENMKRSRTLAKS